MADFGWPVQAALEVRRVREVKTVLVPPSLASLPRLRLANHCFEGAGSDVRVGSQRTASAFAHWQELILAFLKQLIASSACVSLVRQARKREKTQATDRVPSSDPQSTPTDY